MFNTSYLLRFPADFDAAIASATPVEVWQRGQLLETGIVIRHTPDAVQIGDGYYLKAMCQFKMR